ncbi:MAG TPA: carboxypeptidase-like regulatory domain-containing protein [Candidatus Acidoferrales bacterium]|nr:carboxypeptidase-like regulatory domain-containing protein [Candidatus Acidoferrales bacterium]
MATYTASLPEEHMIVRLVRLICTLALVAVVVACQNQAGPPGNYGMISGKITSSSGQPVANVTVQVDNGPSGVSGSDGTYTIQQAPVTDALSPDIVAVTAVPTGYGIPPPQNNVMVTANTTTANVNFTLPPS